MNQSENRNKHKNVNLNLFKITYLQSYSFNSEETAW